MPIAARTRLLVVVAITLLVACTPDQPTPEGSDEAVILPDISVTVPAERQTPFCAAMTDLTTRLLTDPPDDERAFIVETYRSIGSDVPAEIADDFQLVLVALESGAPPPTDPPATTPESIVTNPPVTDASGSLVPATQPVAEELSPNRSPGERLNDYVRFTCRDSQNNPGPPATQPAGDDDTSDDG